MINITISALDKLWVEVHFTDVETQTSQESS